MDTKKGLIELIMSSPSLAEEGYVSPKEYLAGLRQNREQVVSKMLSSAQDNVPSKYRSELLAKTMNIQNRTRGRLGELLGRVVLTQQTDATDSSLTTDKAVFETPYGKRRIDVYWEDRKLAVETKMGYITSSSRIRAQIAKDAYLLQEGKVNLVVWLLMNGGSMNAKLLLAKNGIAFKEGWPIAPKTVS